MAQKVRKVVIPAAGYGTRFLPATKSSPKEMMPIVDKPIIQYVVEGAVAAGIEEVIFITSSNKHALEDYFDYNFELEEKLKRSGKTEQYELIRAVSDMARFVYVRQKEAKGTGHAVYTVKDLIGDEPFLVVYGDEFIGATPSVSAQMVEIFNRTQAPVMTVMEANDPQDANRYGFIKAHPENGSWRVEQIVEKPGIGQAPSNLASVGGFILTPDIFPIIETLQERNGEYYLSEAANILAGSRPFYAHKLENFTHYDTGSKFGYIKANIELGLQHPETKDELLAYLHELRDA